MAFQAVPETAEINVIFTLNAEIVQNVFYSKFGGPYSQTDLLAVADAVGSEVSIKWLSLQPTESIFLRTEVRGLTIENDFFASSVVGAGPGTDIVEAYPNNVTFSVKKESGLTGRSARGRCYWIGIPQDKTSAPDENHLTDAYRDAVVTAVDGIRVRIATVFNWSPVLVSRVTGGVPRAVGVTFPWISTVAVDKRIDTMRSRLPAS